jgi:hypothetical protein
VLAFPFRVHGAAVDVDVTVLSGKRVEVAVEIVPTAELDASALELSDVQRLVVQSGNSADGTSAIQRRRRHRDARRTIVVRV